MSQKSFDGKNALYLIPTPIGNREDITLRSIHILKMVDVIFCEDTRVTSSLLTFLKIKKPLIANHKFNESSNKDKVLAYLKEGKNVGLVSDRGTPGISDPGSILANHVIENNYSVIALPGATAFVPALITSSFSTDRFYFYGFLNHKESKRKQELISLATFPFTLIFYEAPHRICETLENMLEILGNRRISISREITKRYEEIYRGTIEEILREIKGSKGEMVIIVEGNFLEKTYDHLTVVEHVNLYIKEGLDKKTAMKEVAKDRKMSKSDIYRIYNQE